MTLNFRLNPRRVVTILIVIAFYLAIQSIVGKHAEAYFNTQRPHILSELVRLFNINRESSIPTWYASSLLLGAALLFGLIVRTQAFHQPGQRRYWLGLALIFLYLSIDEAAEIHERLTEPLQLMFNASGPLYFAWIIGFIPLLLIFGLVYFRFWLGLPPRVRTLFAAAGILYVGGAIGVEMIGANLWYQTGGSSLTYSTIGTIEEFFEMCGAAMMIYALLVHLTHPAQVLSISLQAAATAPAEQASPAHDEPLNTPEWEKLRRIERQAQFLAEEK